LWPDFDEKAFVKVLDEYSSRVRKYGGLKKGDAQA
ncbi:MAG TPA: isoprenyl transferase, partial [Clostridiales bacterium]|nr:isoprenyl transferase [Clostridiales bacterium]